MLSNGFVKRFENNVLYKRLEGCKNELSRGLKALQMKLAEDTAFLVAEKIPAACVEARLTI